MHVKVRHRSIDAVVVVFACSIEMDISLRLMMRMMMMTI